MGKDVVETIHEFGRQKRLFKVHFRNVDQPLPHFVETFIDDGYMDMSKVMRALRDDRLRRRGHRRSHPADGQLDFQTQ